jgi:hypothetical protein
LNERVIAEFSTAANDANGVPPEAASRSLTPAWSLAEEGEDALLIQQFTLFARDAERREGNILLEYGFESRSRAADRSCYRYRRPGELELELGEFGVVVWSGEEKLRLPRRGFEPQVLPLDADHQRIDPRGGRPAELPLDRQLLSCIPALFAWFGAYERWVEDSFGAEYRHDCLAGKKLRGGESFSHAWWRLATHWRTLINQY